MRTTAARETTGTFFLSRTPSRGVRRKGPMLTQNIFVKEAPRAEGGKAEQTYVHLTEPGGLPAAAAAVVQVQYLLDSRRGGPAEAGGKRWKPTACRFVKNLTE